MVTAFALAHYARCTLSDAVVPELPGYYRGKFRQKYDLADGTCILIVNSAFDAFPERL
jgi:phosphoribosylaminoimidazole-succinocarboxamide synthase